MRKPTKWCLRPAKTQISLGIRSVWSVFAVHSVGNLGAKASSPDSEDSDQTGRMPKLIWVLNRRACHFVFVMLRLKNDKSIHYSDTRF